MELPEEIFNDEGMVDIGVIMIVPKVPRDPTDLVYHFTVDIMGCEGITGKHICIELNII